MSLDKSELSSSSDQISSLNMYLRAKAIIVTTKKGMIYLLSTTLK